MKANLLSFHADVPSLERLCKSCPKLADVILPDGCNDDCVDALFGGLPELRALTVDVGKMSGRFLSRLPGSLRRLRIDGKWHLRLDKLPASSVTELDISGLWLKSSPAELVKLLHICPGLEKLNANGCYITDSFLKQLPNRTPHLRDLNLES